MAAANQIVFTLDTGSGDRTLSIRPRFENNSFLVRVTAVSGSPTETVSILYEVNDDEDYRLPSTGSPVIDLSSPHDILLPACVTGIKFDASGSSDTYRAIVISCQS